MKRRNFLQSTLMLGASTMLPGCLFNGAQSERLLLSGCDDAKGTHYLGAVTEGGHLRFQIPVPQRVHQPLAWSAKGQAIFVARRPGTHLYLVDTVSGRLLQTVSAPTGRHFYGHGALSQDQSILFVSENHIKSGAGVIAVYDLSERIKRVAEIPSHGVGPHQFALLSDDQTLVIANGGMRTDPASGRRLLNLDTMAPNLAYVAIDNGGLLARHEPPHHQMSIRHLDISADDRVVAAIQYQGELTDEVPSLLIHRLGEEPRWGTLPIELQLKIRHYTASVAVNPEGTEALISCPRGDLIFAWDMSRNELKALVSSPDTAGLYFAQNQAQGGNSWWSTNGHGQIQRLNQDLNLGSMQPLAQFPLRWDNHATVM